VIYTPLHRLEIAAGGAPAEAPSIALSAKTSTTFDLVVTAPVDQTNYTRSRVYYGIPGVTAAPWPSLTTTTTTSATIQATGLTAGKRYVAYVVSESAAGEQIAASPAVIIDTDLDASASGPAQIKAAIRTLIIGAAGVTASTVHARRRKPIGQSTDTMQSLCEVSGVVDCWEIEEETMASAWGAVDVAWHRRPHTFVIRTWREWDDADNSLDAHRAVVEAAVDAINGDHTLGGTVARHETVQIRRYGDLEMKAGRLCSVAELVVDVFTTRKP